MFNFLKRMQKKADKLDGLVANMQLINERESFRDNELKLLRSTITKRRKEILQMVEADTMTLLEYERHRDTLNIIEKHALDVAFVRNRERLSELGAPKKRRYRPLHGIEV